MDRARADSGWAGAWDVGDVSGEGRRGAGACGMGQDIAGAGRGLNFLDGCTRKDATGGRSGRNRGAKGTRATAPHPAQVSPGIDANHRRARLRTPVDRLDYESTIDQ